MSMRTAQPISVRAANITAPLAHLNDNDRATALAIVINGFRVGAESARSRRIPYLPSGIGRPILIDYKTANPAVRTALADVLRTMLTDYHLGGAYDGDLNADHADEIARELTPR